MKTLLSIIIIALAGGVFYLWTQLQEVKKELKKQEPKVTINIQKSEPKVAIKRSYHDSNESIEELQNTLKKDFQKIFKDVFGNKEVKEGIKNSVQEFKKGLNQAITELQKNVNKMDKEGGNIFNDLLKELGAGELKTFTDKETFYELEVDLQGDKNAKVNIEAKNGLLSIDVTSKLEQKTDNTVVKKQSHKSYIVRIPKDGVIEMIKSNYHDGKLTITIPKKGKKV